MEIHKVKWKHNLRVITSEVYHHDPDRYELRSGLMSDASPCPYGHRFKWIGFDFREKEYVRFTKSVFKKLVNQQDQNFVREIESKFEEE